MNNSELKLLELEGRIKRLEKKITEGGFNYYYSSKSDKTTKHEHVFKFNFDCSNSEYLKLMSRIISDGQDLICEYFLNGVLAETKVFPRGNALFYMVTPVAEGNNEVLLKIRSEFPFAVDKVEFETSGQISYLEDEISLSFINESNMSVVVFVSEDRLFLKKYQNGILSDVVVKEDVKSGAISKMGNNYLLSFIDISGMLSIELYDDNFNLLNSKNILEGAISVCGFNNSERGILYVVKGNKVYFFLVEPDLTFGKMPTELVGRRVISNPAVEKYMIVVDYDGTGKLYSL